MIISSLQRDYGASKEPTCIITAELLHMNDQQMSLVQNELLNGALCDLPSGEAIGWKDPTHSQAFITPSLRR